MIRRSGGRAQTPASEPALDSEPLIQPSIALSHEFDREGLIERGRASIRVANSSGLLRRAASG